MKKKTEKLKLKSNGIKQVIFWDNLCFFLLVWLNVRVLKNQFASRRLSNNRKNACTDQVHPTKLTGKAIGIIIKKYAYGFRT